MPPRRDPRLASRTDRHPSGPSYVSRHRSEERRHARKFALGQPHLADLNAEAETFRRAIAALEETLRRPGLAPSERDKVVRELAALECQLAQLRNARRHAEIRRGMS